MVVGLTLAALCATPCCPAVLLLLIAGGLWYWFKTSSQRKVQNKIWGKR